MRRIVGVLVAMVVWGVAGVVALAAPAQADPACSWVSTSGTVTGSRQVGPYCVPTPLPVLCVKRWAGVSPYAVVTAEVCVPI